MRRGRPRQNRPEIDLGTPETQEKQKLGLCAEPLDRLLADGRITPEMHRAALHFRWLHSLVYGLPLPRSPLSFPHDSPFIRQDSTEWREAREQEYKAIMAAIAFADRLALRDVCVTQDYCPTDRAHALLFELVRVMERISQARGHHVRY